MTIETDAARLHSLEPDPLEPTPEDVERYVSALQDISRSDPELARRSAWNQIRLAGARAGARRAESRDSLNRIFRLGTAPGPALEGPYRGILVMPLLWGWVDPLLRALASAWMPWVGKRFDPGSASGDNLLLPSARLPARLLWPRYRLQGTGDGRYVAFRFRTYVAPGELDRDRATLKIDYDSEENPGLLIRDILDELVQVVPGTFLGKVLLRRRGDGGVRWQLAGYFALEAPASANAAEPAAAAEAPVPDAVPA